MEKLDVYGCFTPQPRVFRQRIVPARRNARFGWRLCLSTLELWFDDWPNRVGVRMSRALEGAPINALACWLAPKAGLRCGEKTVVTVK